MSPELRVVHHLLPPDVRHAAAVLGEDGGQDAAQVQVEAAVVVAQEPGLQHVIPPEVDL